MVEVLINQMQQIFFVEKNIDGALVGGASLDADIFSDIIEIYSRHREK